MFSLLLIVVCVCICYYLFFLSMLYDYSQQFLSVCVFFVLSWFSYVPHILAIIFNCIVLFMKCLVCVFVDLLFSIFFVYGCLAMLFILRFSLCLVLFYFVFDVWYRSLSLYCFYLFYYAFVICLCCVLSFIIFFVQNMLMMFLCIVMRFWYVLIFGVVTFFKLCFLCCMFYIILYVCCFLS